MTKPMPLYEKTERVRALEINHCTIDQHSSTAEVSFVDDDFVPVILGEDVYQHYVPSQGDFYVVDADGSVAMLPRVTFLCEGFTLIQVTDVVDLDAIPAKTPLVYDALPPLSDHA